MAVLSDQELRALIGSGRLVIDPPPQPNAVSPSTIDLTLANDFRVPHADGGAAAEVVIDIRESASAMKALYAHSEERTIADGESFPSSRGHSCSRGPVSESGCPTFFLAARVEGRSTLTRLGLSVHQPAPIVHPTFGERLQLEMTNAGPYALRLYPGQAIGQLVVETMALPAVATLDSVHQRSGG